MTPRTNSRFEYSCFHLLAFTQDFTRNKQPPSVLEATLVIPMQSTRDQLWGMLENECFQNTEVSELLARLKREIVHFDDDKRQNLVHDCEISAFACTSKCGRQHGRGFASDASCPTWKHSRVLCTPKLELRQTNQQHVPASPRTLFDPDSILFVIVLFCKSCSEDCRNRWSPSVGF